MATVSSYLTSTKPQLSTKFGERAFPTPVHTHGTNFPINLNPSPALQFLRHILKHIFII